MILCLRMGQMGGFWTFPARAGITWLRLDQPSENGRLWRDASARLSAGSDGEVLDEHAFR
jgi:hypothetical protein